MVYIVIRCYIRLHKGDKNMDKENNKCKYYEQSSCLEGNECDGINEDVEMCDNVEHLMDVIDNIVKKNSLDNPLSEDETLQLMNIWYNCYIVDKFDTCRSFTINGIIYDIICFGGINDNNDFLSEIIIAKHEE